MGQAAGRWRPWSLEPGETLVLDLEGTEGQKVSVWFFLFLTA